MYKDELIRIHQLMLYLRKFLIDSGAPNSYFEEYAKLGISPHHIHKTKSEHKYAIFSLAYGISKALSDGQEIIPTDVADRLLELTQRSKEECTRLIEAN